MVLLGGLTLCVTPLGSAAPGFSGGVSVTSVGQSPLEGRTLKGEGTPSPSYSFGGGQGDADVGPTRCSMSAVNLRRVVRVGTWNIVSLSEDSQLPFSYLPSSVG